MNASTRPPLKRLDDALAELLAQAVPLAQTEQLSTFDADGRVLAQDLVSALQVPSFDNSAMDGYAMRAGDVHAAGSVLSVSQRIAAGSTYHLHRVRIEQNFDLRVRRRQGGVAGALCGIHGRHSREVLNNPPNPP